MTANSIPRVVLATRNPGKLAELRSPLSVRERFGATWGLSETGAAGPTGNGYGDAAGHTCVAIAGPVDFAMTIETGQSDRLENMRAFAAAALQLLTKVTD